MEIDIQWKHHSSPLRSSSAPYEQSALFRDEGRGESQKRLWWLTLEDNPKLVPFYEEIGVVGSDGPRWENSFSHALTESGDLWACVGAGSDRKSLLRRSASGNYEIAIMHNSVNFTSDLFGSDETDQNLSVSAVSSLKDSTLLLLGDTGLYRLKDRDLTQKRAFTNTRQKIPIEDGKNIYHWGWDPNNVLVLPDGSCIISGEFGGIYLLQQDSNGKWSFTSLDEKLGEPVTW